MAKIPKRLDRKVVYENKWVNLYKDKVEMPDKSIIDEFHLITLDGKSACVLVTNEEHKILMVKVSRYTTQAADWELPGGGGGADESIEKVAAREVQEETGYSIKNLHEVRKIQIMNGRSNFELSLMKAEMDKKVSEEIDTSEILEVKWFSQEKVLELIMLNKIKDASSLTLLLLYLSDLIE